jgi:hypothetical protein
MLNRQKTKTKTKMEYTEFTIKLIPVKLVGQAGLLLALSTLIIPPSLSSQFPFFCDELRGYFKIH